MPAPNTQLVCQEFNSMAGSLKTLKSASSLLASEKELRAKYPSSFVDGKWLLKTATPSKPWMHVEEKPLEKTFWKNESAVEDWNSLSCYERSQYIEKIAAVLETEVTSLAAIESTLHSASADKVCSEVLPFLSGYVRYYAGWAGLRDSKFEHLQAQGCVVVDVRTAAFPLLEAVWAVAPALAAGNTVNVLACPQRCQSLLHLASCSASAGLPTGTLNVIVTPGPETLQLSSIVGGPSVVFAPFQSAKQAGVDSFVHNAKCLFSLHGRCHMLVLRHADVEAAVQAVITEAVFKSSLSVWSLVEVLVEEHLYKDFTSNLRKRLESLEGSVLPPSTWTEKDLTEVKLFAAAENLEVLLKEGAVLLLGGRAPEPSSSWEAEPRPLPISVLPVRSHAEAVAIMSSRPRSLAASVWTEDGTLAQQVAAALKVGLVWVNQHGTLPNPASRFGNWGCGGGAQFGGKEGLLSFMKLAEEGRAAAAFLKVKSRSAGKESAQQLLPLFYGGEPRKGAQGNHLLLDLKDKPLAQTTLAAGKDVEGAVVAAHKAAAGWQGKGAAGRVAALRGLAEALLRQEVAYAALLAGVCGDAEARAKAEVQAARQAIFKWTCLADKLQGTLIGDGKPGSCLVSRHALGVVGICGGGLALTSLGGLVNLLAPALVLGNTVVLGAAEGNPLAALTLAQALLLHAPLPAGVLNIISSGVEVPLAAHPDLSALWVGEVAVQLSSPTFKRAWRIPAQSSPGLCPEQWLVHQASKQKTVCL